MRFKFREQMYEVFLNERRIVIARPGKNPKFKEGVITENLTTIEDVKNWFLAFISSKSETAVLIHPEPEKFWNNLFKQAFTCVPAAGGIVIRNKKLLYILRNKIWDLPKGKIDKNESAENAALREVAEECGIKGHQITRQLPSTFHLFESPYEDNFGKWILKETFWFEMSYSGKENGTPEISENITEIKWFAKNELDIVLSNTYENLKSLILMYKE